MNAPSNIPPPHTPATPPQGGTTPRPTSGRENTHLMYFFIGVAVLVLLIVVGFNVLGPQGAARSGVADGPAHSSQGPTTGGPSPEAGSRTEAGHAGAQAPAVQARTGTAPQAPESPTPVQREGMGAPQGAAPQAGHGSPQGVTGSGTSATAADAPAQAATAGASALPAAPPASR